MDYTELAKEFMQNMVQSKKGNLHKNMRNSMQGETFILHYISDNGGKVIPSAISHDMDISSARIAAALNSLEGKGYITRCIDKNDRRKIVVELTEAGKKQEEEKKKCIMETTAGMLKYLGEEDAKHFVRILKKLAERGSLTEEE